MATDGNKVLKTFCINCRADAKLLKIYYGCVIWLEGASSFKLARDDRRKAHVLMYVTKKMNLLEF